jgi:integrase
VPRHPRRHRPPARDAAIGTTEIRRLVAAYLDGLCGQRDCASPLLGFAAAVRRSELVAVQREHLTATPKGLRLLIPRAKGDQEGRGAGTCPVRAGLALLSALSALIVTRCVVRGTSSPKERLIIKALALFAWPAAIVVVG